MDDTLALYGTDADAGDTSQLRAVFDVLSKETLDLVLMLNRSLNLSRLIQTTFMLIEMLQLLSYAVPPSTTYLLSASNNQAFANSFALVLESFNLKFLDRTPGGLAFTITSLLILSWMFLFSYVVFAKRKYGRLQIRDSTAVNVLRFSSMAMASMLSLPILDILFGSTSCFGRGLCSQPASSAQYILVLFLGACFAIMSTIVAACLFDPDPSSPTILARSHSRFDVMFQIIKFGFAFLFNTTKHSFLASSIILPGTAFTAYLFCLYPPYHHLNPVKIRTVGTSSVVWALLCRIVVGVSGTSLEHNAVLIFITTVPFIIGASFFVVEVRRSQLAVRPLLLLKNPLEMTLKANAMLEPVLRARELTNKNLSLAALHGEGNAEKEEIILDRVELLYDEAAKSFPKSAMLQIQRAAFNLYYRRNFYSTQHCLQLAQKDKPRPDEQILIFLLRNRVLHDVRHEPDARIAFKYVQFRNTLDDAMENDKKATLVQLDFWKQLRHHDPDLEKMKKLGTEISKALAKAGSGYEKSLELHPNSATALRMRAGFLHDLINDTETGERLVAQATSAMKNERNERLSNSRNLAKNFKAALFDESNIVIIVSGHPDKLGRITSCNDAAAATLGYKDKTDLCRLNVNRIIPPPISDYHASLMRSNLERGIIAFSSKTRLVLLQHRSGYVFPASMYVSMFCENSTNISFIAVMTRFSTKSVYCAVTDETGTVFAISEEAETLFEIQPAEVGSINISELVPDFEENIHKFMYEGGFDMPFIPRKNRTEALAALASGQGTRKMLNVRIQAIKPPGQSAVHLVMMRITEKIKVSATKSRTSASQAGENEHALSMSSSEGQVDEGPPGSLAGNRHAGILLAAPSHRSGVTGGAGGNSSKKKYAQSSIGRSSRSSGMSGMSANMRKRVLSSTNTGMTSNIQRFQIIFTLTLAVIMLVAVVTFVATDNLYTEFRADVKLVTEVAKRRFDAVDAAYAMHILVLHDFSLATAAERTAAIATLHAASDKLFAQSFELYNRRLDMNTAHQQQWNEQTLLLHELTRSDTVESQKYTIWDASLMLVNSARAAAVQAEQTQLPTLKNESNAFMTLNNSAFGILGALNTSTVHVQAQTEGLVAWTGIWATTVNAAAVLIMFVEVWIIVRPAIRQIEANKRAVIDIFREIPVLYVEQLTWRCSIRRNLHENIRYEGLFKSEHLKNYFVDKVEKNFEFDNAVQAETKESKLIRTLSLRNIGHPLMCISCSITKQHSKWWKQKSALKKLLIHTGRNSRRRQH